MRLQKRNLPEIMAACFALAISISTIATPACAQETTNQTPNVVGNNLAGDDRDRGPQNGDLAVSAVTVIDGAYGTNQIATLPNNGGPYHFLTTVDTTPNGAYDPDFTPDGSKIFFTTFGDETRGDHIISVPTEGGPLTPIQTDCGNNDPNCGDDNPAISPNGRELLTVRYVGPIDNNGCLVFAGITRFRIDGSHPKRLSPVGPPCSGDLEPRWSPDGTKVLFQYQDAAGPESIWVMNRNGSHRRQLTGAGNNYVGDASWSPDGEQILFQSPAEPADDQNPQQLYTMHPDGTHIRQITHYAPIIGVVIATNGARWSPDGRKIVFAHRDPNTTLGPDGQPHADLFEMNPDGSDVVQINFTPEKDNNPTWGASPR